MQNEYPIPKDVLTYYVGNIFRNWFSFVEECKINRLIDLSESSNNFKDIKFNVENIKKLRNHWLLFICLPYDLKIWKNELNKYFDENTIEKYSKISIMNQEFQKIIQKENLC